MFFGDLSIMVRFSLPRFYINKVHHGLVRLQ